MTEPVITYNAPEGVPTYKLEYGLRTRYFKQKAPYTSVYTDGTCVVWRRRTRWRVWCGRYLPSAEQLVKLPSFATLRATLLYLATITAKSQPHRHKIFEQGDVL